MQHAFHGVRLNLDAHAADALEPWLDASPPSPFSPTLKVWLGPSAGDPPPCVTVLVEGQTVWLGRTATGFLLGDREGSWLRVEGDPPVLQGALTPPSASGGAQRDLLHSAVLVALRQVGVFDLHAAAVYSEGRALVLVGDSGAGKSTTATALASAGCHYLGDDGVLLRKREGEVELLAYSPWFRLTDRTLRSFEGLKPHVHPLKLAEKWPLDAVAAFPGRFLTHWLGETSLLFLARSPHSHSVLHPLPLAEAIGHLISQSSGLSMDWHPNPRQHLDLLALLVSRAHTARLELGSEWLSDPPAAAQRLLEQARSFSSPVARQSKGRGV